MTTSLNYWQSLSEAVSRMRHTGYLRENDIALLSSLNVASHYELIKLAPSLDRERRLAAIHLIDLLCMKSAGPMLVALWLSDDEDECFKAGVALQSVKCRQSYPLLLKIAETHDDPWRREQACYILSFTFDETLVWDFMRIFSDVDQLPPVRAQAAEGLANVLGHADRRTRAYKAAFAALLPGLRDPSVEVRFWACFALGNMRASGATDELQRLVEEDQEVCPTWWTVSDEAYDAMHYSKQANPK